MPVRETLHARRAALLVHGLPASAREQVVARLEPSHATRLNQMLDELQALGVSSSLSRELRSLATVDADKLSIAHERAARLDARDVQRAMVHCSPVTAAYLLQAADWPWKSFVLANMPEGRRSRVLEHLHQTLAPLPPALCETLIEQLCRHAQPGGDRYSSAPPVGWLQRFKRWLAWTR